MASNVTETPATHSGTNFASPVFILPLTISLAALVAIIVAACVIYRNRQRERTQELARRLHVTERRIDAIGTLKAKTEQTLAARKADNHQCESGYSLAAAADSTHGKGCRNLFLSMPEEEIKKGNALPYVTSTYPSQVESQSSYCHSTRKRNSAAHFQPRTAQAQEVANSSMAVECETIPSVSSLNTIQTGVNPLQSAHTTTMYPIYPPMSLGPRYSVAQGLTINILNTSSHSVTSGQSVSNTGTWGSIASTRKPPASQVEGNNATNFLWPTGGLTSRKEGRLNTSLTSTTTTEDSSTIRTGEGQVEKWV